MPANSSRPGVSSGDEVGLVSIPALSAGERVERTGIALVHEGEYIVPAPGSEAALSAAGQEAPTAQVINYHFPVEVHLVSSLGRAELERVAQFIYDDLSTALARLA